MSGKKFDQGKPPMALVRPEFVEGIASVLGFGAEKYDAWNWASGIEYSRLISALERHIGAFKKGEDLDPESGLSHLYHAGCCLMFLSCFQEWGRPHLDDRYTTVKCKLDGNKYFAHSTSQSFAEADPVGCGDTWDEAMERFVSQCD